MVFKVGYGSLTAYTEATAVQWIKSLRINLKLLYFPLEGISVLVFILIHLFNYCIHRNVGSDNLFFITRRRLGAWKEIKQ
jgi:hypothetical protein